MIINRSLRAGLNSFAKANPSQLRGLMRVQNRQLSVTCKDGMGYLQGGLRHDTKLLMALFFFGVTGAASWLTNDLKMRQKGLVRCTDCHEWTEPNFSFTVPEVCAICRANYFDLDYRL